MAFLNVRTKKGTFYLSDKEDKGEGWEKQEFDDPNNKGKKMVRYHKKLSVKGTLSGVSHKEDKFRGHVAVINVTNEDKDIYSVEIPIYSGGTSSKLKAKPTSQYFNSIVGPLEKLSYGDRVTIFVNSKYKDKDGELYKQYTFLDKGDSLIKSDFSFKDVPSWEKEVIKTTFGEETKYDPSASNKFYEEKFMNIVNRFSGLKEERQEEYNKKKEEGSTEIPKEVPQEEKTLTPATPEQAFEKGSEDTKEAKESYNKLPF